MNFDKEMENQRMVVDSQEQPVAFYCDECKQEIYNGEESYSFINGCICENCMDKELQQLKENAKFVANGK